MRESIRQFFLRQMGPLPESNGGGRTGASAETPPRARSASEGAGDPATGAASDASGAAASDPELRRLHVAACALLLELAHADDEFSSAERMHIEAVLRRHFSLDEETAQELIALAQMERAEAIDLYQFTRLIREGYDLGQKTVLAEIMWGLILSDGEIAQHEAYMLRKIANLLDLKPGFLSQARRRVAGADDAPQDRDDAPADGDDAPGDRNDA